MRRRRRGNNRNEEEEEEKGIKKEKKLRRETYCKKRDSSLSLTILIYSLLITEYFTFFAIIKGS